MHCVLDVKSICHGRALPSGEYTFATLPLLFRQMSSKSLISRNGVSVENVFVYARDWNLVVGRDDCEVEIRR